MRSGVVDRLLVLIADLSCLHFRNLVRAIFYLEKLRVCGRRGVGVGSGIASSGDNLVFSLMLK